MSFTKLFHPFAVPLVLKISSLLLLLSACTDLPAPNLPPITLDSFGANPDPSPVNVGTTFSWSLSGANLTCQLDTNLDGTPEYTLPNCTSQDRVNHLYSQPGTYSARLTVIAPNLSPLEKTLSLRVLEANLEPEVLQFDESEGTTPTSLEFSWTVFDPSSDVLQCRLDANGDGSWDYDQVCNTSQVGVGSSSTWQGRFAFDYGREGEFDSVFEVADKYSRKRKTRRVRSPYNRAPVIDNFSTRVVSADSLKGSISAMVSDRDRRDSPTCTLEVQSIGTFNYKNCSRIIRAYKFAAPGSYKITLTATDGKATTTQTGTLVFDSSPPPVPVGVKQIVAGENHTCVLTSAPTSADQPPEGTALCWGQGIFGQLGTSDFADDYDDPKDGSPDGTNSAVPVEVPAGTTFTNLASGYLHTCGLTAAGKAYCWGNNDSGQLGDGTTTDRFEAVAVQGGLTFSQISAGGTHTCGIADQVYCWGADTNGALGNDPTIANSNTPVAIDADFVIGQIFKEVYAGSTSTCALSTTGSRYCWGTNYFGKLGLGVGDAYFAVPTLDTTSPYYKHMAFFLDGGCALTLAVVCWGNQDFGGKLGDDGVSVGVAYTPVQVAYSETDLPAKMATSSSPNEHSCFLTAAGKAWCWGKGIGGRIGDGNGNFNNKKPVAVAGDTGVLIDLAVGSLHTCAVSSDFKAYCWGDNSVGQLGLGEAELFAAQVVPTLVPVAYQAP